MNINIEYAVKLYTTLLVLQLDSFALQSQTQIEIVVWLPSFNPSTSSTTLSITRIVVRLLWCSVSIWQRLSRRFRSTPRCIHVSFWCTLSHLLTHSSFDHLFVTFWLNRDYSVQSSIIARFAPLTSNSRNIDLVVDFSNHPLPPSMMSWRSIPHLHLRRFLGLQSAHSNCVRHTLHNSQLNMIFQTSQAAQFKRLSRSTCSSTSCNSDAF